MRVRIAKQAVWTLVLGLVSSGVLAAAPSGDAAAGKTKAAACAACHGADGASPIDPTYPHLAGQNSNYLYRQLTMFRDGVRNAALMMGQLNGILDGQQAADYFESQWSDSFLEISG